MSGVAEGVGLDDLVVDQTEREGRATASTERRVSRTYSCPEVVFESEYERLVGSLTVAAGSREEAADAVQEAFVRLIRGWERLSDYDDPAGWVRRVALNLICDRHRMVARQTRLLARIRRETSPGDDYTSDGRLRTRLESLPLKQRTALALYYMEHMDIREVAEVMGVTNGTVKQHLHRGRKALRKALGEARDE